MKHIVENHYLQKITKPFVLWLIRTNPDNTPDRMLEDITDLLCDLYKSIVHTKKYLKEQFEEGLNYAQPASDYEKFKVCFMETFDYLNKLLLQYEWAQDLKYFLITICGDKTDDSSDERKFNRKCS